MYNYSKSVGGEQVKKKHNNEGTKARGVGGFMSGVLVLSFSTLLVKIIGLAVKIPLLSILGAEGMGYFNSAYEIYAMLCVIATAGLPTALSILVSARESAKGRSEAESVYISAMRIFIAIGAIGSLFMLAFAKPLAELIGNPDAYYCILAISPALFLICVSSSVRGYFQGLRNMVPTAVSQMIEAIGKLILGVGFGILALSKGATVSVAASFSVLGLTVGIFVSMLYLLILKSKVGREAVVSDRSELSEISKQLLQIAFPITLGSAILSACRVVDMTLILRRLQSFGMEASRANEIYGSYTTLAVPVFSLVPSLITPISLSLVPQLTAAITSQRNDTQAIISDRAIRMTVLLAVPASMGIAVYSKDILSLLFSGETSAISVAAPLLSALGPSVVFSGLITTTNAILQSYGRTMMPIVSMSIGTAVKIILAYVLIGIPSIGALGAPISTLICDITVTAINLYVIGSIVPRSERNSSVARTYLRPFIASSIAIGSSVLVYLNIRYLGGSEHTPFVFALSTAIISYSMLVFLLGAINRSDIEDIPITNKVLIFIDRIRKNKS